MTIAYAAYTEGCTFLLDEAGVCRRALLKRTRPDERTLDGRTPTEAARLCVGAQYVASIDLHSPGGLVPKPHVGAALLFAYTAEGGRIGVVRTGPLMRFESLVREDDHDSGVRERPEPEPSATTLRTLPDSDDTLRDDMLPDCEDDDDDGQLTVPLRQSGSRPAPARVVASRTAPPHAPPPHAPPPHAPPPHAPPPHASPPHTSSPHAPSPHAPPLHAPPPHTSPPRPSPQHPSPQSPSLQRPDAQRPSPPRPTPRESPPAAPRPSPRQTPAYDPPPRTPWDPVPRPRHVTLRRIAVVSRSESAPTLDDVTPPAGRGMLPRGHRRA